MDIVAFRRKLGLAITAVGAVLPLVILSGGPANAATTYSRSYYFEWVFESPSPPYGVKRCIVIDEQGKFTWTNTVTGRDIYEWNNITLHNPTLTITVYNGGTNSCQFRKTLSKAELRQDWAGYACSFNPSISISYPWGVSFGGWPSCGSRHQGGRRTSPGGAYSIYNQYNTGAPLRFASYGIALTRSGPCYGSYPTITAYVGGSSDTFIASRAQKKCLPWE